MAGAHAWTTRARRTSTPVATSPAAGAGSCPSNGCRRPSCPTTSTRWSLSTGRRLWHYHTGTQTHRSVGFDDVCGEELIEISPDDAERLGIDDGDDGPGALAAWLD